MALRTLGLDDRQHVLAEGKRRGDRLVRLAADRPGGDEGAERERKRKRLNLMTPVGRPLSVGHPFKGASGSKGAHCPPPKAFATSAAARANAAYASSTCCRFPRSPK